MKLITSALIHKFDVRSNSVDDDGDPMIGSYFQFIDENEVPISDLIGPYSTNRDAKRAAQRALNRGDF